MIVTVRGVLPVSAGLPFVINHRIVQGYRIVLTVENKNAGRQLTDLIRQVVISPEIKGPFYSIEETLRHFKTGAHADVIVTDVDLADGKSFSLFDHVSDAIPVIFLGNKVGDALEAFRYNTLGYVMKPVNTEDLAPAFMKLARSRSVLRVGKAEAYRERFLIKTGNRLLIKTVDEAAYFYAEGKTVYLVTRQAKRKYIIDHTLEELERSLDPRKFFRISRKHIICVECIEEVRGLISGKLQVKLQHSGENDLDVSRDRVPEFKKWLDL